jgi:hypothetical protein
VSALLHVHYNGFASNAFEALLLNLDAILARNHCYKRVEPSLPVDCVRFSDVPRLVNITWAPNNAPERSVTEPATEPYVLCPSTKGHDRNTRARERINGQKPRDRVGAGEM